MSEELKRRALIIAALRHASDERLSPDSPRGAQAVHSFKAGAEWAALGSRGAHEEPPMNPEEFLKAHDARFLHSEIRAYTYSEVLGLLADYRAALRGVGTPKDG